MDNTIQKIIPQVLIVGDAAVGKTSLIRRYVDNKFTENYIETIGSDLSLKDQYVEVETPDGNANVLVRLRIYDIGGQEHYARNLKKYAKTSNIFVICYDKSRVNTLKNIILWNEKIQNVSEISSSDNSVIIVGNKSDIHFENQENEQKLKSIMEDIKAILHIETSAKIGNNVDLLFEIISKTALNFYIKHEFNFLKEDGFLEDEIETEFLKKNGYYPQIKTLSK